MPRESGQRTAQTRDKGPPQNSVKRENMPEDPASST